MRTCCAPALLAVLLALCACSKEPRLTAVGPAAGNRELLVAGRTVQVELALDTPARNRGLMHRTELAPDAGMLFVFPDDAPRTFWMANTLIALDLVFLDADGTVQNIERGEPGVERPGYHSARPARMVLELNAGWAERHGLRPGDRIEIPGELLARARP